MALIISRRSSYCPNFATAPDEVTVSLENNDLPADTTYVDMEGPVWMRVDRDTGDVTYRLDETFAHYPPGNQGVIIQALVPGQSNVYIESEVEVVG